MRAKQISVDEVRTERFLRRFWAKVDKSGECWVWTANKVSGYGHVSLGGRLVLAHRAAWIIAKGALSASDDVLHNCPGGDNPSCVNPAHLWIGTHTDNMRDMHAKRRVRFHRGEAHHAAKLTAANVRDIRHSHAAGESKRSIARRFPVSRPAIRAVLRRDTWAHVE